jgi:polysaccharide chain length determinant protein (PEP-CTERM system associated)
MQNNFQYFINEIRGSWRFRWWAMLTVWVLCVVGWFGVFILPDQFEAEARFYVNTTTRLDEVMGGVIIEADENSQIALVRQAMLSGPVLSRVARETDIDLRATTPIEQEKLLEKLQRTIKIQTTSTRRGSDDGIYRITYRDVERDKSLAVVARLLSTFKEDVISGRAEGSDETVQFLNKEIAVYQTRLRGHELAIADFKRENVGLLPGERGGYFQRLQIELDKLQYLEAQLSILKEQRRALSGQLDRQDPPLPGEGEFAPVGDTDARIQSLVQTLQDMLLRYTEIHPDVVATKVELKQLYEQRDRERQELGALGADERRVVLASNPVYQQVQISLNETQIEIAGVQGQITQGRRNIADLQAKVDIIPEIEAKLAELTRDYDQVRTVYAELRQRLEQERLRQKRIGWDGVTFQIIDPPKVGIEPASPDRTRLLVTLLIGGLMAGAGIAWILHQMRPVFNNQRDLRSVTGLPVLGSVDMTWLSRHRAERRVEAGSFLVATVLILLALIVALLFQDLGVEVGASLRRMAMS